MNKLSINKVDDVIKGYDNIIVKDWFGNELKIKKNISREEMLAFVSKVVDACFSDTSDYLPENEDAAIRECVLSIYGNVNMPSDESHKYDILYCTSLFDQIMEEIDRSQYCAIIDAIHNKIDAIVEMNVQHIYMEVNQVINSTKALVTEFSNMFNGITSDDVKNMLKAISGGKLDEEKLVEAYLNHQAK